MRIRRELHGLSPIAMNSVEISQVSIKIGIFLTLLDLFIENNGSFFQKDAGSLLGTDGIYFGTDGIF